MIYLVIVSFIVYIGLGVTFCFLKNKSKNLRLGFLIGTIAFALAFHTLLIIFLKQTFQKENPLIAIFIGVSTIPLVLSALGYAMFKDKLNNTVKSLLLCLFFVSAIAFILLSVAESRHMLHNEKVITSSLQKLINEITACK